MNGTTTTTQIEAQIIELKKIFYITPEKVFENGKVKYNPRYFSLKGKIVQLEKSLIKSKEHDFLAR